MGKQWQTLIFGAPKSLQIVTARDRGGCGRPEADCGMLEEQEEGDMGSALPEWGDEAGEVMVGIQATPHGPYY